MLTTSQCIEAPVAARLTPHAPPHPRNSWTGFVPFVVNCRRNPTSIQLVLFAQPQLPATIYSLPAFVFATSQRVEAPVAAAVCGHEEVDETEQDGGHTLVQDG